MKSIYGFSYPELEEEMLSLGQSKFRAKQIYAWLYKKDVTSFDEMTDISKAFRDELKSRYDFYVPECTVPDANINMHCGSVTISGGIYNDVTVRGGAIKAAITSATFENLHINADELDVSADDITVKNIANAIAHDGRVEIDKAYCKNAECRVKRGNIGICSSTCDFAVLNSGEGNIAASMLGRESDYLVARNGDVSGRENASSDKCIKACAAKGSVVIDFENAPRFNEAEELGYEQVGA